MPSFRHHDHGDMFIQFSVTFPEKNWTQDADAFEALRKYLPSPSLQNVPPAEAMTEPADLDDVENAKQGRVFSSPGMEEDDEEGGAGGERVQCASQ